MHVVRFGLREIVEDVAIFSTSLNKFIIVYNIFFYINLSAYFRITTKFLTYKSFGTRENLISAI